MSMTNVECIVYSLTLLFVGYCYGRGAEIGARIKYRQRKAKAYGGNPWDY